LPTGERNLTTSVFQLGPTDTFCNYLGELAASDNVTLLLHANVAELATEDDPSRVSSVRVVVPGGRGFSVSARMYILAAGGLENARTLLLSNRTAAKGLGNRHDLVGRFFMEHLAVESGVLRPVDPALFERTGLYGPHRVNGTQIQAKLSVKPDVLRRHQLLNSTFFLGPMSEARASTAVESVLTLRRARTWKPRPPHLGAHVANILTHSGPIAVSTYRRLRGRPDDHLAVYQLVAMAEQAPNPYSRVTLSDRRDAFGLNRPRLDWRLTELDTRSIRGAIDIIDDELRQAGLGGLERKFGDERPRAQVQAQWHHMGTTRMDRDERRGVVDPNCKVHGVQNLFVAGSSVFPTSGYANPTLTIVAMALRLADMVKTRFAQLDLPTVESR
jgi:choline dehydrogenase-like flavoprotein